MTTIADLSDDDLLNVLRHVCEKSKASVAGLARCMATCYWWQRVAEANASELWRLLAMERFPRVVSLKRAFPDRSYRALLRAQLDAERQAQQQETNRERQKVRHELEHYNFTIEVLRTATAAEREEVIFEWTGHLKANYDGEMSCVLWDNDDNVDDDDDDDEDDRAPAAEPAAPRWFQERHLDSSPPFDKDALLREGVGGRALSLRVWVSRANGGSAIQTLRLYECGGLYPHSDEKDLLWCDQVLPLSHEVHMGMHVTEEGGTYVTKIVISPNMGNSDSTAGSFHLGLQLDDSNDATDIKAPGFLYYLEHVAPWQ